MDAKRATALSAAALVVAVLGYTPLGEAAHLTSATAQGPKREASLANLVIRVSPAFVNPGAGPDEAPVSCQTGEREVGGGGAFTRSSIAEEARVQRPRWGEWAR